MSSSLLVSAKKRNGNTGRGQEDVDPRCVARVAPCNLELRNRPVQELQGGQDEDRRKVIHDQPLM